MNNTLSTFLVCCLIVVSSSTFSSKISAEEVSSNIQPCDQDVDDQNNPKCTDTEKRSELEVFKLSPQIRVENTKPDSDFNLNELTPFIGGSGTVGGSSRVD